MIDSVAKMYNHYHTKKIFAIDNGRKLGNKFRDTMRKIKQLIRTYHNHPRPIELNFIMPEFEKKALKHTPNRRKKKVSQRYKNTMGGRDGGEIAWLAS